MKKFSFSLQFTAPAMALALAFLASPASAQITVWTGGGGTSNWNTAGNWDSGVPTANANATATIAADGANVTMSAAGVSRILTVSGNGTTAPVLNITQNLTTSFAPIHVGSSTVNATGFSGTINHTEGTVTIGGGSGPRRLYIAASADATVSGNNGTYNFGGAQSTAPVLNISGGLNIGKCQGETGVLTLSGYGTFSQGTGVAEHLIMSGSNGASRLNVIGGNLGINLTNNWTMSVAGGGTSILNATLTSSGFSTINVGGGVVFDNGSGTNNTAFNLSLSGFGGTVGQKITIINAGSAFTGHGVFGNVADGSTISVGGFNFLADYDTINHDFTLEVTAIPEPSTWALLAFSLTTVMVLRRRRAA